MARCQLGRLSPIASLRDRRAAFQMLVAVSRPPIPCGRQLGAVEEAVVAQVRHLLRTPEIIARTWAAARSELQMPEREVVATITNFEPLWDELFPAEQARIVRLLVERVDLASDGMQVRLRAEGLQTLVEELQSQEARAA